MIKMKSIASGLFMAGSLLIFSHDSLAATYYVAVGGSDSNPGTSASPFSTIQKGVNAAKAGDTVMVGNGTYLGCTGGSPGSGAMVSINNGGSSGAPITLQAQTPFGAILDGQLTCGSIINFAGSASNWWVITGLDVRNGYSQGIVNSGSNIVIQGNIIHNNGNRYNNNNYAIAGIYLAPGVANITINGNLLHDNGPSSVGSGDPGKYDHQMYIHGVNVNITNNVFYNTPNGYSIKLGSAGGPANYGFTGTVANNTFYGPNMYTGTLYSGQIYLDVDAVSGAATRPIIQNNIFYYTRGAALSGAWNLMTSANNCVINNNIVYNPPGTPSAGSAALSSPAPGACAHVNDLLNVDPKLTNPTITPYSNSNFQLLAGSPAIGAGVALSLIPSDFNGVSRAGRNDIGAFQSGGGTTSPPPPPTLAISGVSSTGIAATGATIGWTTNVAADGQVVYGPTSAYGSATTLNATLTTSHSAALSGLTAATLYHYAVKSHDSSGNLVTSPDATFTTAGTVVTALAVSAVSATGLSATGGTIGWTTNVAADGQVVYGPTSAYGSATVLNATLTTSHSTALSGMTAGTVYHYAVKSHGSSGNLVTSPDATFTTAAGVVTPPSAGCVASAGTWQNLPQTAQAGSFTTQFDATAGAAAIDGASGVSNGAATDWSSLAAAVRFNNTGNIDARNGGAYAAAVAYPYVTGMTYHFRLVVNVPAHSYSAYVKQGINAEQLIGSNYAFRTEQAAVKSLSSVGVFSDAGTLTTCNASAASLTGTVISAVSPSAIGQTVATIGWTTNNPADTQVQYGPTSAYGVTTTLNGTPTTAHSVSLGGLTAGTVYHFRGMSRDATGALVTSPDATFTTTAAAAVPPVIGAVSATGVGAAAATVGWSTDKPADSQVVYGAASAVVTVVPAGSIYTSATTINTSMTTSHSAPLSGLTASTLYHYAVKSRDAAGNLATSPDATFTTTAASGGGGGGGGGGAGCVTSAGTWQNVPVGAQTGSFTAEFDATSASLTTDGVSGLSNSPASAFTSLAAAVRFNNTGKIDARNAGAYAAASSIPYAAGTSYHFRLVINVPAHTYSAYVKQGANAEILIGSNFHFRTEQATVTRLNNLGALADAGSVAVCNAVTHL